MNIMRIFHTMLALIAATVSSLSSAETFDEREWIVFSSNMGGAQNDIWAMRPDSSSLRNLTQTEDLSEACPSWHGGRIYFLQGPEFKGKRHEIASVLPDGSERRLELSVDRKEGKEAIMTFSVSQQGDKLVYTFKPTEDKKSIMEFGPRKGGRMAFPDKPYPLVPEHRSATSFFDGNEFQALAWTDMNSGEEKLLWRGCNGVPFFAPDGKHIMVALKDLNLDTEFYSPEGNKGGWWRKFYRLALIDMKDMSVHFMKENSVIAETTLLYWGSYMPTPKGNLLYIPDIEPSDFIAGNASVWVEWRTWKYRPPPVPGEQRFCFPATLPHLKLRRWNGRDWTANDEILLRANDSETKYFEAIPTGNGRPTMSPDGKYLLYQNGFGSTDWNLRRRNLATGEEVRLVAMLSRDKSANLHGPQWCHVREGLPTPEEIAPTSFSSSDDEDESPVEDAPPTTPSTPSGGGSGGGIDIF